MVGTGNPKGIFAEHTRPAHEYILDSIVEHMPHMQHACHIGRRDDYSVGFTGIGYTLKQVVFQPIRIPFILNISRIIGSSQFVHV